LRKTPSQAERGGSRESAKLRFFCQRPSGRDVVACLTVKKSDAELFLAWKEVFRIVMVRSPQRQEGLAREGSMEEVDDDKA
jgi:hypothetical protein